MLVLTRKTNESIMIGDEIEVTVIDIKGDQIKLGVNAPRSLSVHRTEVYHDIKNQNEEAASSVPSSLEDIGRLLKKNHKRN